MSIKKLKMELTNLCRIENEYNYVIYPIYTAGFYCRIGGLCVSSGKGFGEKSISAFTVTTAWKVMYDKYEMLLLWVGVQTEDKASEILQQRL